MSRFNKTSLIKRASSALVLIPLTLWIIYAGGYLFMAVCLIGVGICLFEWRNLTQKLTRSALMLVLGGVYICVSGASFYLLREGFPFRFTMALFTLVWASDITAYFFGKFIGGPKMAPKISPNKTWAGMVGAIVGPALGALIWTPFLIDGPSIWVFAISIIIGICVGVIGQCGDLIVSLFKRRTGVKDTGKLIPGHGGLLDRVDSLIPNIPFFYLVILGLDYAF